MNSRELRNALREKFPYFTFRVRLSNGTMRVRWDDYMTPEEEKQVADFVAECQGISVEQLRIF